MGACAHGDDDVQGGDVDVGDGDDDVEGGDVEVKDRDDDVRYW